MEKSDYEKITIILKELYTFAQKPENGKEHITKVIRAWTYGNILLTFFFFWLRWVFIAAHGLSLVAVSKGYASLRCVGFSLQWLLLLRSTGSRHAGFSSCGTRAQYLRLTGSRAQGSVVVAHGLSCSATCGIFPDQGSNPCPLH